MNLRLGETFVYPHHGAVTVTDVKTRSFRDHEAKYVQFRVHHDGLMIELPLANAEAVGIRTAIGKTGIRQVSTILRGKVSEEEKNWSRRFKANQEKITTGDIFKVSEVVRDLTRRAQTGTPSAGEKRQLEEAMRILVSELAIARNSDSDDARAFVEDILAPEAELKAS